MVRFLLTGKGDRRKRCALSPGERSVDLSVYGKIFAGGKRSCDQTVLPDVGKKGVAQREDLLRQKGRAFSKQPLPFCAADGIAEHRQTACIHRPLRGAEDPGKGAVLALTVEKVA